MGLKTEMMVKSIVLLGVIAFLGCQQSYVHKPNSASDVKESAPFVQEGMASWYGPGFHGHKTASGKKFNTNKLTAAHPTLPFGTIVLVTNLSNDKTVEVEINDRGPAKKTHRVIDLSKAAAKKLGFAGAGVTKVKLEVVERDSTAK